MKLSLLSKFVPEFLRNGNVHSPFLFRSLLTFNPLFCSFYPPISFIPRYVFSPLVGAALPIGFWGGFCACTHFDWQKTQVR